MLAIVERMAAAAHGAEGVRSAEEVEETAAFLDWLRDGHFILLGARAYTLEEGASGPRCRCSRARDWASCATTANRASRAPTPLNELPEFLHERLVASGDLLVIGKTNRRSRVHRRARMDDVSVRVLRPGRHDRGPAARDRAVHIAGLPRAGLAHAAPAPQAAGDHRGRGPDRGLARLQGDGRGVRVVPARRAVPGAGRSAARRDRRGRARRGGPARHADRRARTRPAATSPSWSRCPATACRPSCACACRTCLPQRFHAESVEYHLALVEDAAAQLFFLLHMPAGQAHRRGAGRARAGGRPARAHLGRPPRRRADRRATARPRAGGSRCSTRRACPATTSRPRRPIWRSHDIALLERVAAGEEFAVGLQNELRRAHAGGRAAAHAGRRRDDRRQDPAGRVPPDPRGARA